MPVRALVLEQRSGSALATRSKRSGLTRESSWLAARLNSSSSRKGPLGVMLKESSREVETAR